MIIENLQRLIWGVQPYSVGVVTALPDVSVPA